MSLILEVKEGRLAGKQIAVREGRVVTIGRAPDRADFAVSHDNFMSGVHFAVECRREGSRLKDRQSSNGTFLNGKRVTESDLANGDEIRSGRTVFKVRIVAEESQPTPEAPPVPRPKAISSMEPPVSAAPPPVVKNTEPEPIPQLPQTESAVTEAPKKEAAPKPLSPSVAKPVATPVSAGKKPVSPPATTGAPVITIGSWSFSNVPQGWQGQGEFGIQRAEKETFPSNIIATEEMLGLASLQSYVEAQVAMLRQYLREPKIEASLPPMIAGSEETIALDIRYATKDEQVIVLRRIFARRANHIGVLTLTTLEKDLEAVLPALETILAGVSFHPAG